MLVSAYPVLRLNDLNSANLPQFIMIRCTILRWCLRQGGAELLASPTIERPQILEPERQGARYRQRWLASLEILAVFDPNPSTPIASLHPRLVLRTKLAEFVVSCSLAVCFSVD